VARTKSNETDDLSRREACKKIPCSAVGALAALGVLGTAAEGSAAPNAVSAQEDTLPHLVTAKVISQKGTCATGHKVGDQINFAENGVDGKICIHALYAILPKIFAMMYDARFPWLEDPDVSTSACPDAKNPVVFEISRKKA
jgi:uncharacterized repeat protein (TIGR04076 family)